MTGNTYGYVYAVRDAAGLIKIGYSWDPRERWMSLCRQYGPLEKLGCVEGDIRQEHQLQRLLKPWAVEGRNEWFHPSAIVMKAVAMFGPWVEVHSVRPRRTLEQMRLARQPAPEASAA